MATTVSTGFYATFTAAEIAAEWTKYKSAVKAHTSHREAAGGGSIQAGTINGENVSFLPASFTSFTEWRGALEDAQAQLDAEVGVIPTRQSFSSSVARFN